MEDSSDPDDLSCLEGPPFPVGLGQVKRSPLSLRGSRYPELTAGAAVGPKSVDIDAYVGEVRAVARSEPGSDAARWTGLLCGPSEISCSRPFGDSRPQLRHRRTCAEAC